VILTAKMRYDVGPAGEGHLAAVNGSSHLRAVIDMLDAMAVLKAESGRP
jgi:hypothetical protein